MYLHPNEVTGMIKQAENEDEVIVIRCVRKTKASKLGGPDKGDLYDLHCIRKPTYTPTGTGHSREEEDSNNGVLTVFASNRRAPGGSLGDWRRVNIEQVKKVIYNSIEYEVSIH